MKRVELKRVLEILGKGNTADEKTPFAARRTIPNNGSFSKNFENEDDIKKSKEFSEDEKDKLAGPMSIPRKLCFVMSFNFWILYFLALGWLIPCRNLECSLPYSDVVETNLTNVWLLTNLETMNVKGLPSLVMIGYGSGVEVKLSALEAFDAAFVWNNTLTFIPKKIQCDFGNAFDINADGIPDCLLLGFNDLYAFNASNGYVFWYQNIPSEDGNILSRFHPTTNREGENVLIGTCGSKLVGVSIQNGSKVSEDRIPCDGPFDIKIVPNKINDSLTAWSLICDYGDKIEVWSFREEYVLKEEKIEKKNADVSEFALLFSGANYGRSIDLGCDVIPIPGGPLLLSWSDRVVMVTQESTAWERSFPEPLTVASMKVGNFSKAREMLIAAAFRNYTNTVIYIMELRNGTILDSVSLENKKVQSMEKISDDIDLLLLKSRSMAFILHAESSITDPIPSEQTNFALIDYSSGKFKVKDVVTTGIVQNSAINMQRNGETDLLVITKENDFTSYLKYILHDVVSKDKVICMGGDTHRHHYPLEA